MIPYAGAPKRRGQSKPKAIDPAYPHGKRGFAAMDPAKHREIAVMGGKAGGAKAPAEKRSFFTNRELARAASRKGVLVIDPQSRTFARDPELARAAGRKGVLAKAAKKEQGA